MAEFHKGRCLIRISARKEAEAELRRLNRTHRVLSVCNNSLARSVDEDGLLNAFCANLVEVGGYRFAWVGYAQRNSTKAVCMSAHAGYADAELSVIKTTWSGSDEDVGACGLAIRTGSPVVLRDIERESRFTPWRKIALGLGYRSMIALPLKPDAYTFGNFSIFSVEPSARVREQCFLGFREALTNAIKHGNASRIDVVLESPASDLLTLRIADDGVGFDTEQTFSSPTGLGLAMIRERAESIGGDAQIYSTPGEGARVTITVPLVLRQGGIAETINTSLTAY